MNYFANVTRPAGDPRVVNSGPGSLKDVDRVGKALGWISFGIGAAELLAAAPIARSLGMAGKENLLRAFGLREIAAGMLTLSTEKNLGLWSRVAGDALDIATLLPALRESNPQRQNAAVAALTVGTIAFVDLLTAVQYRNRHGRNGEWRRYSDRSGFPQGVHRARGAGRPAKAAETFSEDGAQIS